MTHIADEQRMEGHWGVMFSEILIYSQLLILIVQEITVQDRTLIGFLRKVNYFIPFR